MDIIFNPPVNVENKYIELMALPLRTSGFRIHSLDDIFSSISHFRSIKLVHLNWFENVDDSGYSKAFKSFFRKMLVLSVIRLSGKKLVWTMHNRISHEKKTGKFSRIITKSLVNAADIIIIHNELSRQLLISSHKKNIASKIRLLPHPDFIGCYGPISKSSQDDDKLRLLFVGTIKPYKNIELLIQAMGQFGEEVELTIAGNPKSQLYKKELETLVAGVDNIILKLEFIPDDELPVLMGSCDLLILPYDLASSLNSGTVILGFSYQKTVICPEIGTLADMVEMKENYFTYIYDSPNEHLEKITHHIRQAIRMKKEDKNVFDRKGLNMFRFIQDKYNKDKAGSELVNIYRSMLD